MKLRQRRCVYHVLGFLCILLVCRVSGFCIDREAFTFTNYNLNLQIDPEQHRLGARGRITLRNDSQTPQKIVVLQISSTLDWRAITLAGKANDKNDEKIDDKSLQFVTHPYTSDIDHTGGLTEAIVTLPQPIAPQGTIELNIAYEGVILLDATRLTRIGTPEDVAASSDWDQISPDFTAVRGAGYVAWYPIATESANLSEDNGLFDVLGRWKRREANAAMSALIESNKDAAILFSGDSNLATVAKKEGIVKIGAFSMTRFGVNVPTFVIADYKKLSVKDTSSIDYLAGKELAAQSYSDLLGTLDPLHDPRAAKGIQVVQLPDPDAAPFASENLLLMPLKSTATEQDRLTLIYALARQRVRSPRPWISEGLAHLAQVIDIEHQHGRKAALDYLDAHLSVLADFEKQTLPADGSVPKSGDTAFNHSLAGTTDEIYMQSKAMWVWSMLRDMMEDAHPIILFTYQLGDAATDSDVQKLLEKASGRDLQWFFDDWVYHDHGLPDFKIDSAFPVKTPTGSYIVTVTVTNLGGAGAEVPITVKSASGDAIKRLEVRSRSKAVTRIEVPGAPKEIEVNDGSVPESDTTNNIFKLENPAPAKSAP
jgi:hypothetical protein